MLTLTDANYHSIESNRAYMSNSQYGNFLTCEAMAMASIKGEWVQETTINCMVGSYIHAWNQSAEAFAYFKASTPEMFNKNGSMKAQFAFADTMIETLAKDPMCSYMLEGQKEVWMTAEMFGAPWKIKIDVLKPNDSIIDLKTTKNIDELSWNDFSRCKRSFVENYNYLRQMAIYCEVERLASGRDSWLTPYIVAVSKQQPYPDKDVFSLQDEARFRHELMLIEANMPRILQVKSGEVEPIRCRKCDYCRATKVVTDIRSYKDLEREAV